MINREVKNERILLNFNDLIKTYKSEEHGLKALSKYSFWFPIRASVPLAGIVGDLIGDGHLQDLPKGRLDYSSKSVTELERFNEEVFYLFRIKGKIRDCTTNIYGTKNLGINNRPLVRVLKLLGVPTGPKVFTTFLIPKWILNDGKLFSRFINRLFSCEGCVDLKSKYIEINMSKSLNLIENGIDFFRHIKNYLGIYFGIKTTNPFLGWTNIRKDGKKTRAVRLKIKNRDSLVRFRKFIGFDDINKKKRLDTILG